MLFSNKYIRSCAVAVALIACPLTVLAQDFLARGPAFDLRVGDSDATFNRVGFWEIRVEDGVASISGKWAGRDVSEMTGRVSAPTEADQLLIDNYINQLEGKSIATLNGGKPARIDMSNFFALAKANTTQVLVLEMDHRRDVLFLGSDGKARVLSFPDDLAGELGHIYGVQVTGL